MIAPWFAYPRFSWHAKTATVVGAGIAGRQIAWHLAQRGWKVTLLERHAEKPQEASGNLAGIISPKVTARPSLGEDFYLQCYRYVLQQLANHPQWDTGWEQSGVLQLAYKERDLQRWEHLAARHLPSQLLQCLDHSQASEVAGVRIDSPAVYFPQAGFIKPRHFCAALIDHPDIEFKPYNEIIELEYCGNYWLTKNKQQQIISQSEALIICSGKYLDFKPIKDLPVTTIAGQTSLVCSGQQGQALNTVIDHEGYITPRIGGEYAHLIGASYERDRSDSALSKMADEENLQKQQRHLPELAAEFHNLHSGHAAMRTASPDRLPYIGAVPCLEQYHIDYADLHHGKHWKHYPAASYFPGLFIAAAFASRGLTSSALCANALVSLMENETLPFSNDIMQALHPARFLVRQLKRGLIDIPD